MCFLLTTRYTLKYRLIIEFGKRYNSYAMTTLAKQKKNGEWEQSNMQLTIDAIKNKEMGFLKASKTFGVQKKLFMHLKGDNKYALYG